MSIFFLQLAQRVNLVKILASVTCLFFAFQQNNPQNTPEREKSTLPINFSINRASIIFPFIHVFVASFVFTGTLPVLSMDLYLYIHNKLPPGFYYGIVLS